MIKKLLISALILIPTIAYSDAASYFHKHRKVDKICYNMALQKTLAARQYCLNHHFSCSIVISRGFPETVYQTKNATPYSLIMAQRRAYTSAVFFLPTAYLKATSHQNQPFSGYNNMHFNSHDLTTTPGGFWLNTPHCQTDGFGIGLSTSKNGQAFYSGHLKDLQNLQNFLTTSNTHFKLSSLLNKNGKTHSFNDALFLSENYGRQLCAKQRQHCSIVYANLNGRIQSIVIHGWASHAFSQIAQNRAVSAAIGATLATASKLRNIHSPFDRYLQYMPGGEPLIIQGKMVGAFGVASIGEWSNPKTTNMHSIAQKIVQYMQSHYQGEKS